MQGIMTVFLARKNAFSGGPSIYMISLPAETAPGTDIGNARNDYDQKALQDLLLDLYFLAVIRR